MTVSGSGVVSESTFESWLASGWGLPPPPPVTRLNVKSTSSDVKVRLTGGWNLMFGVSLTDQVDWSGFSHDAARSPSRSTTMPRPGLGMASRLYTPFARTLMFDETLAWGSSVGGWFA